MVPRAKTSYREGPYLASKMFFLVSFLYARVPMSSPTEYVREKIVANSIEIVCLAVFAFLVIFDTFLGRNTRRYISSRPLLIASTSVHRRNCSEMRLTACRMIQTSLSRANMNTGVAHIHLHFINGRIFQGSAKNPCPHLWRSFHWDQRDESITYVHDGLDVSIAIDRAIV